MLLLGGKKRLPICCWYQYVFMLLYTPTLAWCHLISKRYYKLQGVITPIVCNAATTALFVGSGMADKDCYFARRQQ